MKDRNIHGESNVWSTAQRQKKIYGSIDDHAGLAMDNSVCWFCYVLRQGDGLVLRRALDFEVDDEWKKGKPMRT